MGNPRGNNLGTAQGSIVINTTQLAQAQAQVNAFATSTTRAMSGIAGQTNQAQQGITGLAGSFRGLTSALGIGFGLREVTQFAVEVTKIATAYDRQAVAARNLAGSQAEVNALLDAYNEATGNAIDRATALSDVTRLIAVGFADNVEEIEEFTRAVRGISLATGRPQEFVVTQLQLELLNQTGFRLDQIGLGMEEVRRKADALRAANSSLTREQAYQQAVLDAANEKYGDLTKSVEAQVVGVEALAREWKNLRLEMGQTIQGPVNDIAGMFAGVLEFITKNTRETNRKLDEYEDAYRNRFGWLRQRDTMFTTPAPITAESPGAGAVRQEWSQGVIDLQRRTNLQLAQENADYLRNRADAERDYQQTVLREVQDFVLNRQRQEQDLADSIADIHRDAARREQRAAEDFAESISEARDDTNERLAELEEDYQRDREKRARKHRDDILDAAGRLDAKAVADAQRKFKTQEQDAKESYDEQRKDLREQFQEREEDARKSYERQLADAREADAQRIQDMQEDFALRQAREDEDRAIRLGRMAEDHQDQLAEMDRAHGERIAQIIHQAQVERAELDAQAKEDLLALGVRNEAWIAEQTRKEEELEKLWDKFWSHVSKTLTIPSSAGGEDARPPGFASGGFVPRDMLARLHAGELVIPASQVAAGNTGGRSLSIGDVNVTVMGSNASANDIGSAVRYHLERLLEEVAA